MDLVEEIYKITKSLPKTETHGFSLQMQRAAISILGRNFENVVRHAPKDEIKF
jgi:four helix bundle protein